MALEMKKGSRHWGAVIRVKGRQTRFPLTRVRDGREERIPIEGRRPASLRHPDQGDRVFLHSYHTAMAAHDWLVEELNSRRNTEELTRKMIKARTGEEGDFKKVADIPAQWRRFPRKRKPGKDHLAHGTRILSRFVEFMEEFHPESEEMVDVTAAQVRAFMDAEDARGVSPRTWNVSLSLLRSVFNRLAPESDAYRNYLRDAPQREEATVHREPFSDEELEAILAAVREDEVLRGPVTAAICTGMRKGDACTLRWADVNLEEGFIGIRSAKTKERSEIPILPLLREELERLGGESESGYAFPEAAEIYLDRRRRSRLDNRFRQMMRRAGFRDTPRQGTRQGSSGKPLRKLPVPELRERCERAIADSKFQERKRRVMREAFGLYLEGRTLPEISEELGVSKSTVSLHLNTLEDLTGCAVLRRRGEDPLGADVLGSRTDEGEGRRLMRASVKGWHSFRTTFITQALSAGMSEELVRRVTGHTTVDIVREHYLRPGREHFRRAFESAAPAMLKRMGREETPPEEGEGEVRRILEAMTEESWREERDRLLAMMEVDA